MLKLADGLKLLYWRGKSDSELEFIVELNLIFLCIEFILNYTCIENLLMLRGFICPRQ